jgi:hypothetical protein
VPGFLFRHPNWLLPPPHPPASVASPKAPGGAHSLAGEGTGANSDERDRPKRIDRIEGT